MAEIEIVRAHVKEMLDVRGDDATYIEALWNLIEVGGQISITYLASYPEAIPSLKSQFDKVMAKGHKKDDKCLRNEICVLINFVVSDSGSH